MPPVRRSVPSTGPERKRNRAIERVFRATRRYYPAQKLRKGWVGAAKLLRKYNQAAVAAGRRKITWKRLSA